MSKVVDYTLGTNHTRSMTATISKSAIIARRLDIYQNTAPNQMIPQHVSIAVRTTSPKTV